MSEWLACWLASMAGRLEKLEQNPKELINQKTQRKKEKIIRKPTLKRYLNSNVRSRFRKLEEEDFMTAIMLPVQRFRKSSASKVWSDSRKVI